MSLARAFTALASLASCTPSVAPGGASADAPATAGPETLPPPGSVPRQLIDPPRTHLLALRHTHEAAEVEVLPIALGGAQPAVQTAVKFAALPDPNWPGHFTTVAAHDGAASWAHVEPDGAGARLVVRPVEGPGTRTLALPRRPSALMVAGSGVIVGAENTIGRVDLVAGDLTYSEIHRREEMRHKAYDLLTRSGSWLIAIDDVVRPIYADSFRLADDGTPTHTAGWSLPGVVNGHYTLAALAPTGARDGVLYTVTPYGIMDGSGQILAALPIAGDQPRFGPDAVLNAARGDGPAVLAEHVSRATGKSERLVSGAEVTGWQGLALLGARVLLAAGTRGLLVVPTSFTDETKAAAVEVGGPCNDVLVDGERTFALVGGAAPALVELRWDGDAARELRRTPLPASHDRLLR